MFHVLLATLFISLLTTETMLSKTNDGISLHKHDNCNHGCRWDSDCYDLCIKDVKTNTTIEHCDHICIEATTRCYRYIPEKYRQNIRKISCDLNCHKGDQCNHMCKFCNGSRTWRCRTWKCEQKQEYDSDNDESITSVWNTINLYLISLSFCYFLSIEEQYVRGVPKKCPSS